MYLLNVEIVHNYSPESFLIYSMWGVLGQGRSYQPSQFFPDWLCNHGWDRRGGGRGVNQCIDDPFSFQHFQSTYFSTLYHTHKLLVIHSQHVLYSHSKTHLVLDFFCPYFSFNNISWTVCRGGLKVLDLIETIENQRGIEWHRITWTCNLQQVHK